MKRIIAFVVGLTAVTGGRAVERAGGETVVLASYVEQHGQELRQIRRQVDLAARAASEQTQSRFEPVYDVLVQAEQALAELKTATDAERPQRRAQFEEAKVRALRLWRDFKLTPPPAETTSR